MHVIVRKSSDPAYWYSRNIGAVFKVLFLDSKSEEYVVRDYDGFLNIIKEQDCEVVRDYN